MNESRTFLIKIHNIIALSNLATNSAVPQYTRSINNNWQGPKTLTVAQDEDGYGFSLKYFLLQPNISASPTEVSLFTFVWFLHLRGQYLLLKVSNRNTRALCEICSKSTIKTSQQHL